MVATGGRRLAHPFDRHRRTDRQPADGHGINAFAVGRRGAAVGKRAGVFLPPDGQRAEMPKKPLDFPGVPAGSPLAVLPQAEAKPLKVIGASTTAALAGSPRRWPQQPSHWTKWVLAGLGVCPVLAVLWRIFQPPPSASLATQVYVRTFPPGAKVFLGGELLGTSNGLFVVPPGPAGIAVNFDGHKSRNPPDRNST